jgi:hypothetical protein
MTIEELWPEIEAEAGRGGSFTGWVARLARPEAECRLSVGLETSSRRRGLLLRVARIAIPSRNRWPSCRGLELFARRLSGDGADEATLGVTLKEPRFADVFTALAEDLARRVTEAGSAAAQVKTLLRQLARWQKFLAATAEGLSVEEQRGLFGELHVLRAHLVPALGSLPAVNGWTAPNAAHQDFQFATGAVEVKTTVAKQPQSVRITSERQLDDTGIAALFLHVVVLDEREVDAGHGVAGETLPALVEDLRRRLQEEAGALETFDDRLLDTGYLDAHAPRYEGRRFSLRRDLIFRIGRGFPRVVECDLPEGVGDVSYALSLAACREFSVAPGEMTGGLAAAGPAARRGE